MMLLKLFSISIALTGILTSAAVAASSSQLSSPTNEGQTRSPMIQRVSVQEASQEVVQSGVGFIDVREADEYAVVAAKGAKLFPLSTLNPDTFESTSGFKKDQKIYIICRSGSRSMKAASALAGQGFSKLFNVEGGTIAWENAGLPVVHGK